MTLLDNAVKSDAAAGYGYADPRLNHSHEYLLPALTEIIENHFANRQGDRRIFDLGCGNGSVADVVYSMGFEICGVDPSIDGIQHANNTYANLDLHLGSAYDDLANRFGQFPLVYSLEVVEHVYSPRAYARTLYNLVAAGGAAVVSTPYHGYWKNLALALSGKMDRHFTALWDHGHIKFWSRTTLGSLLEEAGFSTIEFRRVGRIPTFAKSMIAVARKL